MDYVPRFKMIDNYVYLYHTDTLIIVPEYADQINDKISINYQATPVLARTAPIYSYVNSGPRSMSVTFNLHRDLMTDINYGVSNTVPEMGDDYVDLFIKQIQAAALPSYVSVDKLVKPPIVAVRLGDDIFIKGVVRGGVGVTYNAPIIAGITDGVNDPNKHRYAKIDVAFDVEEIDPYDAEAVMKVGSFRGLSTTLERKINGHLGIKG